MLFAYRVLINFILIFSPIILIIRIIKQKESINRFREKFGFEELLQTKRINMPTAKEREDKVLDSLAASIEGMGTDQAADGFQPAKKSKKGDEGWAQRAGRASGG